jgi:hypothetical protein
MQYTDKIKASKIIIDAVNRLRNEEYIVVSYGTDSNNEPVLYRIKASFYGKSGALYSIIRDDVWAVNSMNINEFTNTQAKAYTYDMMSQRTTYNFPLYEMTLVNEPFMEQDNTMEWEIK